MHQLAKKYVCVWNQKYGANPAHCDCIGQLGRKNKVATVGFESGELCWYCDRCGYFEKVTIHYFRYVWNFFLNNLTAKESAVRGLVLSWVFVWVSVLALIGAVVILLARMYAWWSPLPFIVSVMGLLFSIVYALEMTNLVQAIKKESF